MVDLEGDTGGNGTPSPVHTRYIYAYTCTYGASMRLHKAKLIFAAILSTFPPPPARSSSQQQCATLRAPSQHGESQLTCAARSGSLGATLATWPGARSLPCSLIVASGTSQLVMSAASAFQHGRQVQQITQRRHRGHEAQQQPTAVVSCSLRRSSKHIFAAR